MIVIGFVVHCITLVMPWQVFIKGWFGLVMGKSHRSRLRSEYTQTAF